MQNNLTIFLFHNFSTECRFIVYTKNVYVSLYFKSNFQKNITIILIPCVFEKKQLNRIYTCMHFPSSLFFLFVILELYIYSVHIIFTFFSSIRAFLLIFIDIHFLYCSDSHVRIFCNK